MKVMILAAGKGIRMKPLTDNLPKPLLPINGSTLIEMHVDALATLGFREFVINLHYLGEMIEEKLGDGSARGIDIQYSKEAELLETGGGVKRALPLLGDGPFLVVSADTYIEFNYGVLRQPLKEGSMGRLVMVPNPAHHQEGDYGISDEGVLTVGGEQLTYSGVGVLTPSLVEDEPEDVFMLRKVFDPAVTNGQLEGLIHEGFWSDVGTVERYRALLKER